MFCRELVVGDWLWSGERPPTCEWMVWQKWKVEWTTKSILVSYSTIYLPEKTPSATKKWVFQQKKISYTRHLRKGLFREPWSQRFGLEWQLKRAQYHLECLGTDDVDGIRRWTEIRLRHRTGNSAAEDVGRVGAILHTKAVQVHIYPLIYVFQRKGRSGTINVMGAFEK